MTRFVPILSLFCFLAAPWFAGTVAMIAAAPEAKAQAAGTSDSLQKRRQRTRARQIDRQRRQCRIYASRLQRLRGVTCFKDDVLDTRRNICVPRGRAYPSYSRWDRAAGRCRPRDIYEGGTCKGTRRQYQPGRRHAQTLTQSMRMYGQAAQGAVAALNGCRATLNGLRKRAATHSSQERNACRNARKTGRGDLQKLYCK